MNKRGLSDLLVILLFIILIVLSLILLYNVVKFFLHEEGEIAEIKTSLINTQMSIKAVQGDLTPDQSQQNSTINVSISIDKGLEFLKNETILQITKAADVFLLSDVSGSMEDILFNTTIPDQATCSYACKYLECPATNWTSITCKAPNNDAADCAEGADVCNTNQNVRPGNYNSTTFSFSSITCKAPNNDAADCASGADVCHKNLSVRLGNYNKTTFVKATEILNCSYQYYNSSERKCSYQYYNSSERKCSYQYNKPPPDCFKTASPNCQINPLTQSCTGNFCNYPKCNAPGTIFSNNKTTPKYLNTYKINISQTAAKNFTDAFLGLSETNQLGIIPFSTAFRPEGFHPLSSNANSLKLNITKWKPLELTCTCCAINEAVTRLTSPANIRAIVLISDGNPTENCTEQGTGNPQSDAVKAAQTAFSKGIKVYAIGFGLKAGDTKNLTDIAAAGNGSYYNATDADDLAQAYKEIITQISKEYELVTNLKIAVVFSNEKQSYKHLIDNPPKQVFESKKYEISVPTAEILNIKRIEIYPVLYTKSGKEIIGPLVGVWKAN